MSEFNEPWELQQSGFLNSVYCADSAGDFIAGRSSDEGPPDNMDDYCPSLWITPNIDGVEMDSPEDLE